MYEFLFSFSNPPPIVHSPCVPARYVINFVPASSVISVSSAPVSIVSSPVVGPVSPVILSSAVTSSSYSVVSSANFVLPVSSATFVFLLRAYLLLPFCLLVPVHLLFLL